MYIEKLIAHCIKYLEIKANVEVKFRTKFPRNMKGTRAYHNAWVRNNKVIRHVIQLLMIEDARDAETVIAHEFVHAWQDEYAPKSAVHGVKFQVMATRLREYLNENGFNIKEAIYCPEMDK